MAGGFYRTVAAALRYEGAKIKGSRFIASAAPVRTPEEALALVATMRGVFPDANHHGYAYRLGLGRDSFRYSDDGEPSGSAGRPILQQIDGRELTDTVVVVSRIFGGTKLGVGGLVRAYGGAAAEALERAEILRVVTVRRVRLAFAYELSGAIQSLLVAAHLEPVEASYGESVVMRLEIPEAEADAFLTQLGERTSGRVSIDTMDD